MKILSAAQMREADAFTIKSEPVSSLDLMERAAAACAARIADLTDPHSHYLIFCGKGNNGGDGLAVARLLNQMKRHTEVFIVEHSNKSSADHTSNLERLKKQNLSKIHSLSNANELQLEGAPGLIIIDALLGTGVNKPVDGILASVIDKINSTSLPVISIDMPSGLPCDEKPAHDHIVRAATTLTFQRPKFTFFFSENSVYTGAVEVLDIGLNEHFIESQNTNYFVLTEKDVAPLIRPRKKFSHKGVYGHALLLAGSKGKTGAAVLAAKACLRTGAGLLTVHLPASSVPIMQTALPEAMVSCDEHSDIISGVPKNKSFDAVGIGPGIGTEKETAQALKVLIQNAAVPTVMDADALNMLAENKTWISFLAPFTILTPHPKEFDRLCGTHTSGMDRLQTCIDFAHKHQSIVVLKGAYTAVVWPDKKVFFNSTGNPALAKGGSGDVLTGIILGLLSQGYAPEQATMLAVFVHGRAADLYVKHHSEMSMLASDIIDMLPRAFLF